MKSYTSVILILALLVLPAWGAKAAPAPTPTIILPVAGVSFFTPSFGAVQPASTLSQSLTPTTQFSASNNIPARFQCVGAPLFAENAITPGKNQSVSATFDRCLVILIEGFRDINDNFVITGALTWTVTGVTLYQGQTSGLTLKIDVSSPTWGGPNDAPPFPPNIPGPISTVYQDMVRLQAGMFVLPVTQVLNPGLEGLKIKKLSLSDFTDVGVSGAFGGVSVASVGEPNGYFYGF